jgi:protein-tyrosine phosphatase
MIDLHCHVLDETVCGPESFDQSLEMCRAAALSGVRTIVATPVWDSRKGSPPLPIDKCSEKVERLQREMQGALMVKLGFALQFSSTLPDIVARYGSQIALGGKRHILVSMPPVGLPVDVEEVWSQLERQGFLPIIAHPECHPVLRRTPNRLAAWVSKGAVLQVDAASLTGAHGRSVRRLAIEYLVRYKESVVVASNARRGRPNMMGKARNEITRQMGEKEALRYLLQTPTSIVGGPVTENPLDAWGLMSRLTLRLRSRMNFGLQRGVS